MPSRTILITGATSGIGEALARLCIAQGYTVGATGRRIRRLEALKGELGERLHIRQMDVTDFEDAKTGLAGLAEEMGGMDIVVLNAGVSNLQDRDSLDAEQHVIDVNVSGFVQLANTAYEYFKGRKHGHIVGISSVASLLGYGQSAAYNASKAFISTYMQGYRQKAKHTDSDIVVTDIRPGFVESEMTGGAQRRMFWIAPADKAARQILTAIEKRRNYAYVTKRWRIAAWAVKLTPDWIIDRIGFIALPEKHQIENK
ncbi:MAG: SDR family NAD(P)-dependent oxidoreductase [Balneolaceae bacterium]